MALAVSLVSIIEQDLFVKLLEFERAHGSCQNVLIKDNNTVLHEAVKHNSLMIATYLCATYPLLCKKQNNLGQTPLHLYCLSDPQTPTLGQTLIPCSDLSQVDGKNQTAQDVANQCAPDFVRHLFNPVSPPTLSMP